MRRTISDMAPAQFRMAAGFTLIELIVVMVISGLISGAIVVLVRQPLNNYVEASQRTETADIADAALRQIARELRMAVPNTIRISADGRALEFIPALAGGRYFAPGDVSNAGEAALNFSNPGATVFTATFADPPAPIAPPSPFAAGNFIIVYNLGTNFSLVDAYQTGAANGNRAQIVGVAGNNITFGDPQAAGPPTNVNVFARAAPLENGSPTQRFHVASGPVIYRCQPRASGGTGQLRRITGQGFNAVQAIPAAAGLGDLLVDNVQTCLFNSVVSAHRNGALVSLQLTVQRAGSNQPTLTLFRQLQVDNTP